MIRSLFFLVAISMLACNTTNVSEAVKNEFAGTDRYFDYDQVDHYSAEVGRVTPDDQVFLSPEDSLKDGVIYGDIPKDINDQAFIAELEKLGYKKKEIDPSKFAALDDVFSENDVDEIVTTSCMNIYRDILVFKKQGKVVGTAKICFECAASQIRGTQADTEAFGMEGEYEKLKELLK